jgi:hypothetical protein
MTAFPVGPEEDIADIPPSIAYFCLFLFLSLRPDLIMSFNRDLLRVSETNRILADHVEFHLDLEEAEAEFGPTTLPRRILKDRENPLESMRPVEFR